VIEIIGDHGLPPLVQALLDAGWIEVGIVEAEDTGMQALDSLLPDITSHGQILRFSYQFSTFHHGLQEIREPGVIGHGFPAQGIIRINTRDPLRQGGVDVVNGIADE
jgi:hypothetical protein